MSTIGLLDVAWLFVESDRTPMHVGCVQIFSLPADADRRFVSQQAERLIREAHCHPPFSLRMRSHALTMPEWEEVEEVDLEYHVQQWALPEPGRPESLQELIGRLHAQALDIHRPLWEFHLIEGLTDRRFAIYIKLHHSMIDGISAMRMLTRMLSPDPQRRDLPAPWASGGLATTSDAQKRKPLAPSLLSRVRQLSEQLQSLPDVSGALAELAWAGMHHRHSDLQAPYTAPASLLNQPVSAERSFASAQLPLSQIRQLAEQAGVSINDVLLSLCAGALRSYLIERKALPDEPLIAGLPVSVRAADDDRVGTAISFILASLATHLADPRERLYAIHATTRAGKAHLAKLDRDALTEYTLLMMAPFMTRLFTGRGGHGSPAFNLVISNVPGPQEKLYFNGAGLEAMYPLSVVTHGQALNITILGYHDQLHIGLSACKRQLPKLDLLARAITIEMSALQDLLRPSSD